MSQRPMFKLRNYLLDIWRDDKEYFLGRVLTIVDASVADKEQRKGIKDLIKEAHYNGSNHREQQFREILLSYINKFSKEESMAKEEQDGFLGIIPYPSNRGEETQNPSSQSEIDYWS